MGIVYAMGVGPLAERLSLARQKANLHPRLLHRRICVTENSLTLTRTGIEETITAVSGSKGNSSYDGVSRIVADLPPSLRMSAAD